MRNTLFRMKSVKTKKESDPVEDFIALPDSEKNRIYAELDGMSRKELRAKSRSLTNEEWAAIQEVQKKMKRKPGRPKLGTEGARKVSISIEHSLLERLDQYAKEHNLKRSEAFAKGAAVLVGGQR